MNFVPRILHRLGLAIQLLTRFPIRVSGHVTNEDLAGSTVYYPFVGMLIGFALAFVGFGVQLFLPVEVAVIWIVAASILFTGNLHVDGLMDTADGLFGAYNAARRLEIMKDSNVGAYGVVAAIVIVVMKVTLLWQLKADDWLFVLPVTMTCARWSLVYGARKFDYARAGHGLGQGIIGQVVPKDYFLATVVAFSVVWLLLQSPLHVGMIVAGTFIFSALFGRYVQKKIGGMTGDTLGAMNEMIEVTVMTIFVAAAG